MQPIIKFLLKAFDIYSIKISFNDDRYFDIYTNEIYLCNNRGYFRCNAEYINHWQWVKNAYSENKKYDVDRKGIPF